MNLKRTLLRPLAFVAGRHAMIQADKFLRSHSSTPAVQEQLLMQLVSRHAQTAFGQDHGFDKIRSYQDFVSAVPVNTYETLRPYMNRVLDGDTAALLPPGEDVLMFSQTSGTTSSPKFIPVTKKFLSDIRRGWNIFGLLTLKDHSDGWLRSILQISSSMYESKSPTGLPCGAISGLLAATQKKIVRKMYAVPLGVAEISDPQSRYYTILRCGIEKDIGIITTANPSSVIKLIEVGRQHAQQLVRDIHNGSFTPPGEVSSDLKNRLKFKPAVAFAKKLDTAIARDGKLMPSHFWNPAFITLWTGGTLKLYIKKLREMFPDTPIRDIGLLASEGRFSIPIQDETPAGVAEILSNFLEFIPVDGRGSDQRHGNISTLRAHELEVGQEYFLVLSNWAGLWRYNLDDRVKVVDKHGLSPVIEFLSRGLHTSSITGEKITEHQVVEAMRRACVELGLHVERFVLQGRFAEVPYYELRLEQHGCADMKQIANVMDSQLCKLNVEYDGKRSSGRLGEIKLKILESGTLEKAEKEKISHRRGRVEQYKHQYLVPEILES